MYTVPSIPAPYHVDRMPGFLASADGHRWLGALAENFPHASYERCNSDRWELKRLNAIGARILDAHYEGGDVDEAVAGEVSSADCFDTWYHSVAPHIREFLRGASGQEPDEEVLDTIRYGWEEGAIERDTSTPQEVFTSHDRVELLFRFNTQTWLDDALIHSHKPWADFSALAITDNLCFALSQLGFTLGDYRKASGTAIGPMQTCSADFAVNVRLLCLWRSSRNWSRMPARPPFSSAFTPWCRSTSFLPSILPDR